MSKPICYAVMPYGGDDEILRNHFYEVFQLYIEIPANRCGYDVIREDLHGHTGPIPARIIKNLAEADLVIADVSTVGDEKHPNFNVAYELGIRHALVKRGTILIRNVADGDSAFDVRQIKTIKYGETTKVTQDEIEEAIRRLETQKEGDNEVHTTYPGFSDRMVDYLEGGDVRIFEMQQEIESLCAERDRLKNRLNQLGISLESNKANQLDVASSIKSAMKSIQYSGKKVLVSLQQELNSDSPDYDSIAETLEMALTVGHLSEGDFRRLRSMFSKSELPQLTSLILEVAADRYPASLDFKSYLADVYSDTYETWDKAMKYANEVLKVTCDDDGHYHTTLQNIDSDQLAACFNSYIGMDRYDIIAEVGVQLLDLIPDHREIILRNLGVAYRQLSMHEDEHKSILRLIQDYPMNDINHYRFAAYYLRKKNFVQAYYQFEMASALDPEDVDYMFAIAGVVIDRRLARIDRRIKQHLSRDEAVNLAIPFLYRAFEVSRNQSTLELCQDFLLRNRLHRQFEEFADWIRGGEMSPELNFDAVNYINELASDATEEYFRQIEV